MSELLARLQGRVRHVASREDAAHALLSELLTLAAGVSARYDDARIQRAVLHLRPEGGYQGVLLLEPGAASVTSPDQDPSFLSSATAWRHVQAHRAPVALDVLTGTLTIDPAGRARSERAAGFEGTRTLTLMRARKTTHLLVIPIIGVGGRLCGQVSVEAHCMSGVGKEQVWTECAGEFEALAELAAPYLLQLPAQRRDEPVVDRMLPVVGEVMGPIVRNLRVFARHDETLLLLGDTGTGKTRLARWSHARSRRAKGPFEVVDLGAIPADLHQGELFGWRKGAFTGAERDQTGAIERAAGGTLFIDEIDKLDRRSQASLLRVLEDGSYRILGGEQTRSSDVRFIVGTNADLDRAMTEGRFLPDLYYRINVLPVRLPPLAGRLDEIVGWARFMLERRAGPDGRGVLEPGAESPLLEHRWPGNLRQLDNVMRRAFALALIELEDQGDPGVVTIGSAHVVAALAMERGSAAVVETVVSGTLRPLEDAAAWVAAQAARLYDQDRTLPLELVTSAFRGLVLLAALQQASVEEAFESLGRGNLVKSRNHRKSLQSAKEQIDSLRELLDAT